MYRMDFDFDFDSIKRTKPCLVAWLSSRELLLVKKLSRYKQKNPEGSAKDKMECNIQLNFD